MELPGGGPTPSVFQNLNLSYYVYSRNSVDQVV